MIQAEAKREPTSPVGMEVPEGGSNCQKCEYLKDEAKRICGNPRFIKWNGSSKIPKPVSRYCCNYFNF